MNHEKHSWPNCIHGLLINQKTGKNIYVCSNESVVQANGRPSGKFGGITYVELTPKDRQEQCHACVYYAPRKDARTHRK